LKGRELDVRVRPVTFSFKRGKWTFALADNFLPFKGRIEVGMEFVMTSAAMLCRTNHIDRMPWPR